MTARASPRKPFTGGAGVTRIPVSRTWGRIRRVGDATSISLTAEATDRLALAPQGNARYDVKGFTDVAGAGCAAATTMKTPYRDGTTHMILEPLVFIVRLPDRFGQSETPNRVAVDRTSECPYREER